MWVLLLKRFCTALECGKEVVVPQSPALELQEPGPTLQQPRRDWESSLLCATVYSLCSTRSDPPGGSQRVAASLPFAGPHMVRGPLIVLRFGVYGELSGEPPPGLADCVLCSRPNAEELHRLRHPCSLCDPGDPETTRPHFAP